MNAISAIDVPTGAQLVGYLYPTGPPWARMLPARGETLILHGDPGSGVAEAIAWLSQTEYDAGPVVCLDAGFVADYPSLVRQVAIAIVRAAMPQVSVDAIIAQRESPGGPLQDLSSSQEELLPLLARLVDADAGVAPGALADVVRQLPAGLIVIADAHLLTERWARRGLWELRGVVQEHQRHAVVLGTLTATRLDLEGPSAAFFGAGPSVEVGRDRDVTHWERVAREHGLRTSAEDRAFLISRSFGLVVPTLELLIAAEAVGAAAALEDRAQHALERLALVLRSARIVSRYGPTLLDRLARGLRPYSGSSATARDTSRALRQLHRQGFVARSGPRGWRVADPFIGEALLRQPPLAT
jgi:hypothetical protein